MQQLQASVVHAQSKIAEMRQILDSKDASSGDVGGLIHVITKGQMKGSSPNTYVSIQVSGSFTPRRRAMKDLVSGHDPACNQLPEAFEKSWCMEDPSTHVQYFENSMARGVPGEVDEALHVVIGAFLEGEARVLADTRRCSRMEEWLRTGVVEAPQGQLGQDIGLEHRQQWAAPQNSS